MNNFAVNGYYSLGKEPSYYNLGKEPSYYNLGSCCGPLMGAQNSLGSCCGPLMGVDGSLVKNKTFWVVAAAGLGLGIYLAKRNKKPQIRQNSRPSLPRLDDMAW